LLLLSGLFTIWAGPLASPAAAAAPSGVVVAWGDNGGPDVPAGLSGVTAIAAGEGNCLALKSDGTVVGWGWGNSTVPAGLSGVIAIAGGGPYNLALKSNGTLVEWPSSYFPPGLSGVTAIAASGSDALALKSNGTVLDWPSSDVPAGLSGVTAIAAGNSYSLALKSNGTVVAWGSNSYGQTDVPAGLSDVTAISAGVGHSLALKSNGTVVAWGSNSYGQTDVPAGLSGVTAIAAGYDFSLAVKSNGTVVAWGTNDDGETTVPAGLSGVTAVAGGIYHGLALVHTTVSTLGVSGVTTPRAAGSTGNITVAAKDAHGNTDPTYRGTIHFTSSDAAASLPANYTFTAADAGAHVFVGSVTLKTAGSQSVSAKDTLWSSVTGTQSDILVQGATSTNLAVSAATTPWTAGKAASLRVTATDTYGNVATGYRGTIHFTSSDTQASLPADYAFVAADAGSHTFSVTLETAGTQSVTATDTATQSLTGSVVQTVVPAGLAVYGMTTPRVADSTGSIRVTALDAGGKRLQSYRGTVHFTNSDPDASLPSNYTFTAADAGTHVFFANVILRTAGTWSVSATDTMASSVTGVQSGIVVTPHVVTRLLVYGMTTPRMAGSAGNLRVTALDAAGKRVYSYRGTVHFTSSDDAASLPSDYTFKPADNGTHVFGLNVILETAGTQSVTATDTSSASITCTQTGIFVNYTPLVISGLTTPRTAGTTGSIRVTAVDTGGTRNPSYLGTIHFTSSDPKADLPADYTFTAADAGTHVFVATVIFKTPGTWSVTATDTATASIKGVQSGIVVTPGRVSKFVVSGYKEARWDSAIRVTATDVDGNRNHGYVGTVHFTSSDPKAYLPADYTFTTADAGTHVFTDIGFNTAGIQSVTTTDIVNPSITGTQTGIVVNRPYIVAGLVTPRAAGSAGSIRVSYTDGYGHWIPPSGTVHFTSTDPKAELPADYTFTTADRLGSHVFTGVILNSVGTWSVTATDTANPSITGSQTGIVVN
jgi:alpha-tubulin suppressor-like RCC1 family protein